MILRLIAVALLDLPQTVILPGQHMVRICFQGALVTPRLYAKRPLTNDLQAVPSSQVDAFEFERARLLLRKQPQTLRNIWSLLRCFGGAGHETRSCRGPLIPYPTVLMDYS